MTEQERFAAALAAVGAGMRDSGIGTLGEKSLHAVLKTFYEPDPACHEIPVGGYVADIVGEDGVIEIQTRQFSRLIPKLDAFLEACRVTVVYPILEERWTVWLSPEGELVSRRKSPKKGRLSDVLDELYALQYALDHPRFTLCLCRLEVEDRRLLDGYGPQKKRRATKLDRIPLRLIGEERFYAPEDYLRLLPEGLPEVFTRKEAAAAGRLTAYQTATLVNLLCYLGQLEQIGTRGRAFLYRRAM